jgi:hypothetical protein
MLHKLFHKIHKFYDQRNKLDISQYKETHFLIIYFIICFLIFFLFFSQNLIIDLNALHFFQTLTRNNLQYFLLN